MPYSPSYGMMRNQVRQGKEKPTLCLLVVHLSPSHLQVSVQFSCSVVSDSLQPYGLQHTRLPCPSPTPGVYPNSCSLSQWCHPTISSSVVPFSSCLQSFPVSGSFQMSQFFASDGQSIGVSASLPGSNLRDGSWFRIRSLLPLDLNAKSSWSDWGPPGGLS